MLLFNKNVPLKICIKDIIKNRKRKKGSTWQLETHIYVHNECCWLNKTSTIKFIIVVNANRMCLRKLKNGLENVHHIFQRSRASTIQFYKNRILTFSVAYV